MKNNLLFLLLLFGISVFLLGSISGIYFTNDYYQRQLVPLVFAEKNTINFSCPICPTYNLSCPEPVCNAPMISCPVCKDCNKPDFLLEAEALARQHGYTEASWDVSGLLYDYNCVDYAEELHRRYQDMGVPSKIIYGKCFGCECSKDTLAYHPDYCLHTWVCGEFCIESTTGKYITPEEYKQHYERIREW